LCWVAVRSVVVFAYWVWVLRRFPFATPL
jgi:hypothetical protein